MGISKYKVDGNKKVQLKLIDKSLDSYLAIKVIWRNKDER